VCLTVLKNRRPSGDFSDIQEVSILYKLLISDDEIDKLEVLRDSCDWEKNDIILCGEARNGMEAYELLVAEKPDVCIIDIRMPVIDGLEAIRRSKIVGVNTKFIILSGYDDFEYAQQAIRLATVEYLLKPCRLSEIMQAVLKCVNLIIEERSQAQLLSNYRSLYEGYWANIKHQLLGGLICGDIKSAGGLDVKIAKCGLVLLTGNYAVCVLRFGESESAGSRENDLLFARMTEIIGEILPQNLNREIFVYNGQILIIVSMDQILETSDHFFASLDGVVSRAKLELDLRCAVGVSDIKSSALKLCDAYMEASTASGITVFSLDQNVTLYAELEACSYQYPYHAEKKIITALSKDENQVHEAIEEFFACFRQKTLNAKNHCRSSAITLIYNLLKISHEKSRESGEIPITANSTISRILSSNNLDDIEGLVIDFLSVFSSKSLRRTLSPAAQIAVSYVKKNFSKRISLESVAEEIHICPSYLSTLFKQQTGYKLTEYLNRCRIEKSKELLGDPNLKTYEVAYRVGFQDEKYFYLLFKRYTGLTATQYRNSLIEFENVS
jgi:Response regulator containing CheY-like receiver domain and AraC-type DNA-binding domain